MKKLISALLSAIIMLSMAMPAMAKDNITVEIDGREIVFDVQPQIINDRTMVPLRAIFEALGASVEWEQITQTVTSVKDDTIIKLTINSPAMIVNGSHVTLDTPACIIDERTLVPVRAISEAFNLKVDWDGNTKTVVINSLSSEISTPTQTVEPTPVPSVAPIYDNVTTQVDTIKSYISKGMYLEAMELCDSTVENYNLSTADKVIISDLYDTAETKYDEYIANSKPVYTISAFDSLKNSIMTKGTYKSKYSEYSIDKYNEKTITSLSYGPAEDEINISILGDTSESTGFTILTIRRNENVTGGYKFEMSYSEYWMLFEFKNGRRVITHNEFPSYLEDSANKVVNSAMSLFDTMLKTYTNVTLADFGVYY